MAVYGYVREEGMTERLGECDQIFGDDARASQLREGWAALMEVVRDGDVIRVASFDRITRSAAEFLVIQRSLSQRGVDLEVWR